MSPYSTELKPAFDFSDGYGSDPIQRRYGISERDIERALRQKQLDLELRTKESEVVAREVSINSTLSRMNYENRLRAETEAQLTDAYQALGQAASTEDYANIARRYPNALRDDAFKSALDTGYQTAVKQHEYVLKAAEIGALRQYDQLSSSGVPATRALAEAAAAVKQHEYVLKAAEIGALRQYDQLSSSGVPAPRALAEAAAQKQDQDLASTFAVRGIEVPREEDGSLNREAASRAQAEIESQKLAPEERQFVLDKWRMLSRQVADDFFPDDASKQDALTQMQELEQLLDPRVRRKPQATATPTPATKPNDDYFQF